MANPMNESEIQGFLRHEIPELDTKSTDSIWSDDASGKLKEYADFLTTNLLANERNFVLNINGDWGSGKTFFIERWIAELENQACTVIRFNAWENDCSDDPFISLAASIIEKCEERHKSLICTGELKKVATNLLDLLAYGFFSYHGCAGIYDKSKEILNDACKSNTPISQTIIDRALEKIKITKKFKEVLEDFAEKVIQQSEKPMLVFIDELDRCRPSYAIELLERVKHLFNVNGIKFVIVSATKELCESIRGIYGAGFNSESYLQRFFDQTFNLPLNYHDKIARKLLDEWNLCRPNEHNISFHLYREIMNHTVFGFFARTFGLTAREMEQVSDRLKISFKYAQPLSYPIRTKIIYFIPFCFLLVLRVKNYKRYKVLVASRSKSMSKTVCPEWKILKSEYFNNINSNLNEKIILSDLACFFGEYIPINANDSKEDAIRFIAANAAAIITYSEIIEFNDYVKCKSQDSNSEKTQ